MLLAPLAAQAAGLREEPPSTCVLADNYMNAQYTVPVQLGAMDARTGVCVALGAMLGAMLPASEAAACLLRRCCLSSSSLSRSTSLDSVHSSSVSFCLAFLSDSFSAFSCIVYWIFCL